MIGLLRKHRKKNRSDVAACDLCRYLPSNLSACNFAAPSRAHRPSRFRDRKLTAIVTTRASDGTARLLAAANRAIISFSSMTFRIRPTSARRRSSGARSSVTRRGLFRKRRDV